MHLENGDQHRNGEVEGGLARLVADPAQDSKAMAIPAAMATVLVEIFLAHRVQGGEQLLTPCKAKVVSIREQRRV